MHVRLQLWSHHFMGNRWGNSGNSVRLYFLGLQKSLQMVIAAMKLKDTPWKESNDKPRQCVEKQRHNSANKGLYSQGYGLPSGHVQL